MPAQPGGAIVLNYGPQGSQQAGGAILLQYGTIAPAGPTRNTAGLWARWGASALKRKALTAVYQAPTLSDQRRMAPWGSGQRLDNEDKSRWGVATLRDDARDMPWGGPQAPTDVQDKSRWGVSTPRDHERYVPWAGPLIVRNAQAWMPWNVSAPRDKFSLVPWGGPLLERLRDFAAEFAASAPQDVLRWVPWVRYSRTLNPGTGIVTPDNPQPDPGDPINYPAARFYIVINEATLVRSADNLAIPAFGLSIQFDADSWLPSFSAEVPATSLAALTPAPDPVEVTATVNSYQFKFLVERITRSRTFATSRLNIGGRNPAATLGQPYDPSTYWTNATQKNAQQIVADALENTGWTINWGITDWLVPANAFKAQGTRASVALRVAEAAGAVLVADHDAQILRFLPRYPTLPWEWAGVATPDYTLPTSLATTEGVEWTEQPAYNRVFVSGSDYGIIGNVKITGTAGDLPAPMVTDGLITAEAAARQRGKAILGNTGRKAMMTLSLPMPDDLGPLDLSKLVAFGTTGNYRRGLVRGVQIRVDAASKTVRQTVTIEAAP